MDTAAELAATSIVMLAISLARYRVPRLRVTRVIIKYDPAEC